MKNNFEKLYPLSQSVIAVETTVNKHIKNRPELTIFNSVGLLVDTCMVVGRMLKLTYFMMVKMAKGEV